MSVLDLAGGGVGDDDVEPMLVAAHAREIQLVAACRSATPPGSAAAGRAGRWFAARLRGDLQRLILEAIVFDDDALLRCAVEDLQLGLRRVRSRRASRSDRFRASAAACASALITQRSATLRSSRRTSANLFESRDQMMGIGGHARVLVGEFDVGVLLLSHFAVLALILLLLLLLLLALVLDFARRPAVAVVLYAVGGQLDFDDGGVVGFLERLGVVVGVHHEEVVVAREHDGLAVR